MKVLTSFTLAILPLLATAQNQKGWLFETSSGRAQGIGSRSCQRFYMKKSESWTLKLEPMKKSKKVRSASPEPQNGWGNAGWGNGNTSPPQNGGGGVWENAPLPNGGGTWNPTPDPKGWAPLVQSPPPNYNGGGSPSWSSPTQGQPKPPQPPQIPPINNNRPPPQTQNGGNWNGPKAPPPANSNRPPQNSNGNGGQWNGPVNPPLSPARALKCCVKMYVDDDCKDVNDEGCVIDKKDEMFDKGKANKDAKSFNVYCR